MPERTGGVSAAEIRERLLTQDASRRLVVSPWTGSQIEDGSLDVRLGTKFIETQRSSLTHVDPLDVTEAQLREIQSRSQVRIGFSFIIHPGQFVLAATLEYVSLPPDLGAYVVTRSTYGRLGLLTATAVYVHAGYKGCLTLELVNEGDVPLQLYPGLRVAQLVFNQAEADEDVDGQKYTLATEPEFPKIHRDHDNVRLATLRESVRHLP